MCLCDFVTTLIGHFLALGLFVRLDQFRAHPRVLLGHHVIQVIDVVMRVALINHSFGLVMRRLVVSRAVLGPTGQWRVVNGLFSVISETQGATIGRRWLVIRWHFKGFVCGWLGACL